MFRYSLALVAGVLASTAHAADTPRVQLTDPFSSGMWEYHQIGLLGDPADIRFDDRVKVIAPAAAEDAFNVPLLVDATALDDVEEIVISVDYGPIPKILSFFPGAAEPKLALRFKIDQATPIRASVRTRSGAWHVGGTLIDAAGGGCTAPAQAYASDDWEEKLGEIHGRLWAASGRARLIVDHPMDTGLADGIPLFIIEELRFSNDSGEELARLALSEPVNEDPAFTLYFNPERMPPLLHVRGRDNNGNEIEGTLTGEEVN
ncbi:quinoprotein dehydrogenase-associated SoxYZ-like carrier [Ruegeria marina]|uniref:Sulfur-oxidizing protein SoxY n=1 Tax=Ruegeria marina TaxID=639004 RepID=A0A1G6X8M9_9RHOB|nr:quinoprotein dehydrogenase-associated SoxYZ-like carrier [Ruegeria marina]SDD74452.1 sulfur-oxidizing protein SoxY [Ruegeria marina]